jgi:quercetin dioxygenase-like cupin family protein
MKRRLTWLLLCSAVIAFTVLYHAKKAQATAPAGFTSTTLALGKLGAVDILNYFVPTKGVPWFSFEKTQGFSDLYVVSNDWQPGGSTGWHSHPGHSLIVVTAGTISDYEGADPKCRPHVYTAGMAFADEGGNHVHIVRNEGTVEATAIAVQLIPSGQPRRIDAAAPGNCPF